MNYSILKFIILFTLCAFSPFHVEAAELRLDVSKIDVRVEEEFVVEVFINIDESVNAVEGKIVFPKDILEVREIRDSNSSVNFWIEKPSISPDGELVFSGITPGGFSGVNNLIFSTVFKAKKEGTASISTIKIKALQNDGLGTELPLTLRNVMVNIKSGDSTIRKETLRDTDPPELFTPIIASDPLIANGKHFVVFSTQDKGSGIKHYKIREGRFGWWREVESPYFLMYQSLTKDIYIRAIDNANNERVAFLPASVHREWWKQYELLAIIIILFSVVMIYKKVCVRFIK